jgi:hypothetical protein
MTATGEGEAPSEPSLHFLVTDVTRGSGGASPSQVKANAPAER